MIRVRRWGKIASLFVSLNFAYKTTLLQARKTWKTERCDKIGRKTQPAQSENMSSSIPWKNENSTPLKAIISNTKFREILLIKKKRIKSKNESITSKIIRKKNEQPT